MDRLLRRWPISMGWFFDKPDDNGTTPGSGEKPDDSAEGKPEQSDKPKAGDEKPDPKAEKKFSQAELDDIVKDRLDRERKKAETAAEKARKDAEQAALEKNQEWQKLAETRAQEIAALAHERDQLAPYKDQAERYKAALDAQLEKIKEGLPKHLRPLIDPLDPIDAMKYITDHAKELSVAGPLTYPETPEHKEKKVSADDEQNAQRASSSVVTRNF